MTNRPHLLTTSFIETAPDGVHNDGGAIEGCALEIHIRNGGKSKRAYYRYNGQPFPWAETHQREWMPYAPDDEAH